MESLYRSHKRSFEQYHPRPPTAFPSSRLGVRNPTPKLQSLLSQERIKLRTSSFVRTFLVSIGTKARYKFRENSCLLVNTLETFQGTHILGASRGPLCDCYAVLLISVFAIEIACRLSVRLSVTFLPRGSGSQRLEILETKYTEN